MDSTNTSQEKNEFDIRDVASYILGKIWLIALVVLCFAAISFLYTSLFVTPLYTSTSSMFIINTTGTDGSSSQTTSNWSIGKQLAKTSPKLITLDFCNNVADDLNNNQYDFPDVLEDGTSFSDYYKSITGNDKISGSTILSCVRVLSDDETCIIEFKSTTFDAKLSALITNAVSTSFEQHIKTVMNSDTIRTSIAETGKVPSSPSNMHRTRNMAIAGVVGLVAICAILIVIFIFDDKIKTPDDIERQLKLSVLGTIPEIEGEA